MTLEQTNLRSADLSLSAANLVVFTPDGALSVKSLSDGPLDGWMDGKFDGEPVILPSDVPLPADAPRVRLQSEDSRWTFSIGNEKSSITWARTGPDDTMSEDEFQSEALRYITEFARSSGLRVVRLGVILTWFAEHTAPGKYLVEQFCQPRWQGGVFAEPASFQLHFREITSAAGGVPVNHWTRFKTGNVSSGTRAGNELVIVEQDINSIPDEMEVAEFVPQEIRGFFESAIRKQRDALPGYFDGDTQ